MKERTWRLSLLLWLVCFAALPVSGQVTKRAELPPDRSATLSPDQLSSINNSLTTLEHNFAAQKKLSDGLKSELEATSGSLEMLKTLSIEQALLIGSLRLQWTLVSERLQESDESWVWIQQDIKEMEADLTREIANNARLEKKFSLWKGAAITLSVGATIYIGYRVVEAIIR
jgi:chromosome segregation ATPase